MPPRTTTAKPTQTTTKRPQLRSKPTQVSPDELADKLATGLTISKGKAKQNVTIETSEERRVAAMRAVNAALQGLSSLVQSGWKASTAKPPIVRNAAGSTGAAAHATSARTFLKNLRTMTPEDLDVEKAALSVVGKLIVLELYHDALEMLSDTHAHLLQLYDHDALPGVVATKASKPTARRPIKSPVQSYLAYLCLPLSLSDSAALNYDLLTLISTYLSHATTAFTFGLFASEDSALGVTLSQFVLALHSSSSLISWIPFISRLPSSHIDLILTRTYTTLTKSSGRTQKHPQHVFRIRHYALLCLLYTSPSTVAPNTFWDQVVKFAVAFARSTPALWLNGTKNEQDEAEATDLVLSIFSDILEHAEKRSDSGTFLSGKSFVAFCDYWLGFAKKAGDINSLDRIAALVHSVRLTPSPGPSVELASRESPQPSTASEFIEEGTERASPDSSSKSTKRNVIGTSGKLSEKVLQLTKLGTSFVQAGAYLDSGEGSADDFTKRMREIIPAIESFRLFSTPPDSPDRSDEYLRVEGKVDRALERLRRACLKVLDRSPPTDVSAKLVKAVLIEIATAFAAAVQVRPSTEFYTSTLDTCFALARTTLVPSDPRTHDAAYGFLSQAADALGLELKNGHEYSGDVSRPSAVGEDTFANYVRCLSGAFHNLAGTLYQADKHGTSIRFLRQACVLGKVAVQLRDQCSTGNNQTDEDKPKQDDAWKQLDEQLSRRWELLGVCYSKIGDRKLAYEAFVESIVSYAFPTTLVQCIRAHGPNAVFDAVPGLKQIGTIIDRITYMATCELLRSPSEASLKRIFEQWPIRVESRQQSDQQCILGAILERQMASLEGSRWKDGVKDVIAGLLSDALSVYDAESRPIRRAVVMLRCLEFTYYSQAEDRSLSCLPLRTEEYGQHIDALLASELRCVLHIKLPHIYGWHCIAIASMMFNNLNLLSGIFKMHVI
ncbi:hypothetical protein EWM64_g1469 [Hericium alpestre]|uniref:Uncharacterized protein n=1 Tax=Hericium alpestre TaxID=135208 RepID=A0A4Z0A737_9AGAM|nr:hypothetical protein EWM64_g1469 [Hericium alpestre]